MRAFINPHIFLNRILKQLWRVSIVRRGLFRELKGDVTRVNSQRRFLAQYSVATLLRRCFELLQHCSIVANCPV